MFTAHQNHSIPGVTYYRCQFFKMSSMAEETAEWKVVAYPLFRFSVGFLVRHLTVVVSVLENSTHNASIVAYGGTGTRLTPSSAVQIGKERNISTYVLSFNAPWSLTRGNATLDVTIGGKKCQKAFLFHRHSSDYYTLLTVLMLATTALIAVYLVRRTKRCGGDPPYTRDLE